MILGVDPGKTTGFLLWSEGTVVAHGQLPCFEFLDWAERVIAHYGGFELQLVCEKFHITMATVKKASDAHWAIGSNFMLGFWCERYGVPLATQTPAAAKSFATDDKLRRVGWYQPTKGGHANDGARHVLLRLVELGRIRPKDFA